MKDLVGWKEFLISKGMSFAHAYFFLAIEIVNDLHHNLSSQMSLTDEQSLIIAVAAAGALNVAKTELLLAGVVGANTYEDMIEEFSDELVVGSLDALDKMENVHQRQINKVVSVIVSSVMESLEGHHNLQRSKFSS